MLSSFPSHFDGNIQSTMTSEVQTVQSAITIDGMGISKTPLLKFHLTGFQFDTPISEFLDLNFDVALKLPEIVNQVNSITGLELSPRFELVNDEETGEVSGVVFQYTIPNKTYEEILDLWDKVSEEVCKNLDIDTAKKVSIILNGE